MKGKLTALVLALGSLALFANAQLVRAQTTTSPSGVTTLWVNQKTGQVFVRPGHGRVPLKIGASTEVITRQVEENTKAQVEEAVSKSQAQQQQVNSTLSKQITDAVSGWKLNEGFLKKFKLSTTVYGDYALYTHTGYGPQFLTQINPPGPGNNMYNSFDITRSYLNFFFMPDKNFTVRVTPNIYRQVGSAGSINSSKNSVVGSNINGNLTFRLKYALIDWNTPFDDIPMLKGGKITFGQETNPLVDWVEHVWGFRYIALTSWNWMSLSSTYPGLSVRGPIRLGRNEVQYANYDLGVFNNSSFHSQEQGNTKQIMARLSVYPFGTEGGGHEAHKGLGITGFYDYGYTGKAPDYTTSSSASTSLHRIALLLHYDAPGWAIAGEFDQGRNAFSAGHLWSASAPPPGSNAATLASVFLNNSRTDQTSFSFFGHYDIPGTPFTLLGYFQQLYPNTNVSKDPFDLQRIVFGVQWAYSKHLKFALDSQNLLFYHKQFTVSASELAKFDPGVAAANPNGIAYAVPRDTHAIFLNVMFDY